MDFSCDAFTFGEKSGTFEQQLMTASRYVATCRRLPSAEACDGMLGADAGVQNASE